MVGTAANTPNILSQCFLSLKKQDSFVKKFQISHVFINSHSVHCLLVSGILIKQFQSRWCGVLLLLYRAEPAQCLILSPGVCVPFSLCCLCVFHLVLVSLFDTSNTVYNPNLQYWGNKLRSCNEKFCLKMQNSFYPS